MPTYEQLDAVADAVNPALLIVTLALPALPLVRNRASPITWYAIVALALATTYSLMGLDSTFGLWRRFDADYSAHAAFAMTLVIAWSLIGPRSLAIGSAIVLMYCALMLHQRYHSVRDIASTLLCVILLLGPCVWLVQRRARRLATR